MVTGLLVHGIYLGGVFAAIKWGMPAGISAIVVGVQPILTAFLGRCFLGARLTMLQWIGLFMGFIGVAVVLLTTNAEQEIYFPFSSLVAALAALFGISIGTLYQKHFGRDVELLSGTLWQYISAGMFFAIIAYGFESREVLWTAQLVLALGWLVLGLSMTAILLLMYMIREGEVAKVASYFYLVPPAASLEAWLLFNEELGLFAIGGIGLAVLGVYLVISRQVRSL